LHKRSVWATGLPYMYATRVYQERPMHLLVKLLETRLISKLSNWAELDPFIPDISIAPLQVHCYSEAPRPDYSTDTMSELIRRSATGNSEW